MTQKTRQVMVDAWLRLAIDAMKAAKEISSRHPRSVVSRTYYAAFAHTHGMLLGSGQMPRSALGTWRHADLPAMVRKHLAKSLGRREAELLSQNLRRSRILREYADYRPNVMLSQTDAVQAIDAVSSILGGHNG